MAGNALHSPKPPSTARKRLYFMRERILELGPVGEGYLTELLVDATMRALGASGAQYVTLGLAPLSRHSRFDRRRMAPWLRVALYVARAHGRRFYNFEGLDRFKAKFEPHEWEEIVALANQRSFPPRALRAIAGAFSDGSPVWLLLHAVGKGIRQEARWLGF